MRFRHATAVPFHDQQARCEKSNWEFEGVNGRK